MARILVVEDETDLQQVLTAESPRGIAVDRAGNVYVTAGEIDFGTSEQRLFTITPAGVLTALTVLGTDGRREGVFFSLTGVAIDALGSLYVTDNAANVNTVNKIVPSGLSPVITLQPQSQTALVGGSVSFSVGASATPSPTYQWYFNQVAISGAIGSTYSLPAVQAKDAGDYSVVVANPAGEVTSAKATLALGTTTPPPASSDSGGQSGGGAMGEWFAIILLGLSLARFGPGLVFKTLS